MKYFLLGAFAAIVAIYAMPEPSKSRRDMAMPTRVVDNEQFPNYQEYFEAFEPE